MSEKPESLLRQWRSSKGYSLDEVCDLIKERGLPRPSAAKLSRIERDQEIPLEMVPAIEAITGIPAKEQRPEIAKIFAKECGGAQ